ncbi:DUF2460 domain-containing protein [Sphingomonas sp. ID1715]|uniref:DUF2460 domain-containing protein n=1 Tax=Sphingomonas sp. ID1715 TaxID=1656898 RepID=UPI00148891D8|nr:DUF2460 domain-containing protein [Sphingomonas sp. ID1715]NNM76646.1 DUF2460 domain-containing protein [Sphingomonas sp. ID1715]
MGYWLTGKRTCQEASFVKRFDARFWTVDFPRPMMASVVTNGPNSLRVDAVFYRKNDLAGLIWWAEDRYDHPLLAYETDRDFRRCTLRFRWRSSGVVALDAVHGPTLKIEGRDASGAARSWYVRLWNYAVGTPEDAVVTLDFSALESGFALPGEAVFAGDVDRMFISLVPPDYDEAGGDLATPAEGWAELTEIACDGSGSVLAIGDVLVPAHQLRIATGYDDGYNVTPERLLRNTVGLGYRGVINHYVGMSHYFRLNGGEVTLAGGALNAPCAAWHADFAARAKALDYELILSLSYELFDAHCPAAWKQRAADGSPALTGWVPPSTLLSPANSAAMGYLQAVALSFADIAHAAGLRVRFQIGEPWWWIAPDGGLCVHDTAALAAAGGVPSDAEAGAMLAASTATLSGAVKAAFPDAETLLLLYLPTIAGREVALAPLDWASPAFDVLQLEDYQWVTGGDTGASARGAAAMSGRLGYPADRQHYLSGFVLRPEDRAQWDPIAGAVAAARQRGVAERFVWALPQVIRDGFTWFDEEEDVEAFANVAFPLDIGREASVEAETSTAIAAGAGGAEQRNAEWAEARLRFDAGPGVRSEADLAALVAFFRARRGPAQAFRFRDPLDDSSAGMTGVPGPLDQLLGLGDGVRTVFALMKDYDGVARRITLPVPGSVRVAADGVESSAWEMGEGGTVIFDAAPAAGAEVTAGYRFDVAVRFAEDRLTINRATFLAGEAVSVPLIEVREG